MQLNSNRFQHFQTDQYKSVQCQQVLVIYLINIMRKLEILKS